MIRVLVLDDSSQARLHRVELEAGNIHCETASDVESAWMIMQQQRPGVVVLSMELADGGGQQFLERLTAEDDLPQPYLVGIGIPHERRQVQDLDALVLDPTVPGALLDTVQALCQAPAPMELEPGELAGLMGLSTLDGDVDVTRKALAEQLCQALGASACFLFMQRRDWCWSSGADDLTSEQCAEVARRAIRAARIDTALIMPALVTTDDDKGFESYFAVHATMEAREMGVLICLVQAERYGRPSAELRQMLGALAGRFRKELSWLNVHQHLSAELDTTRDAGGLDPLLGIWNRASLTRLLNMMESLSRRTGNPLVVAILDVMHMGEINDQHGHEEGDAVLKHIAEITVYVVRGYDVVARYGGDEIAIVFTGATMNDGVKVVERLLKTIEEKPFETGAGTKLKLQVAAGITSLSGKDDSGEEALSRAAAGRQKAQRKRKAITIVTNQGNDDPKSKKENQLNLEGVTLRGVFRILHQIGAGGGGGVYRAEDLSLRRPVAVKVLNPDLARKESLVERFREEATILASLRHNNLVQVYAFGVEDSYVYFAMELVEGESLRQAIDRCRKERHWFSLERVIQVVSQISSALATLHRSGIIHRDVKPANILMDPFRGRAVLVDVGIALQSQDEGWLAGTPGYMAPESARKLTRDASVDVYGLAVTIYELLTLHLPWPESSDPFVMLRAQTESAATPPSERRAKLEPLDAVLLRAIHPKQEARWPNVEQFGAAMQDALEKIVSNSATSSGVMANPGPGSSPMLSSRRVSSNIGTTTSGMAQVPDVTRASPGVVRKPPSSQELPTVATKTASAVTPEPRRIATSRLGTAPPTPGAKTPGSRRRPQSSAPRLMSRPPPGGTDPELAGAPTMSWDAALEDEQQPATRGVVFRTLPRVVGARSTMKWRLELGHAKQHLVDALSPSSPPLGWLPTAWLAALLTSDSLDSRGAEELGRALGRSVVRATFRRFFPASSVTLSPASTLQALPQIWSQYHTWGVPQPMAVRSESATIRLTDTVASEPLSALTQGMIEGLIVLSGGDAPIVEETQCEARGDEACLFDCKWTWSPQSARKSWRR